jgi:hypothetical protein
MSSKSKAGKKKAGEEWARRIVARELKQIVTLHDDNSVSSMYDLRVGSIEAPEIAIEVIGAVDPVFIKTWMDGPAKGPLELSIKGDWTIVITHRAQVKIIRRRIEHLLQKLEDQEVYKVEADHWLEWEDTTLFNELKSLHITHVSCALLNGTGKVYLIMPGIGGPVDSQGVAVSKWIEEFLCDPARQDVLAKLQHSGAVHRHVFVPVHFAGAPWSVKSYLTGELDKLPSQMPQLPSPVTGVWIVSKWGRSGLRWDKNTWKLFDARGEAIDD